MVACTKNNMQDTFFFYMDMVASYIHISSYIHRSHTHNYGPQSTLYFLVKVAFHKGMGSLPTALTLKGKLSAGSTLDKPLAQNTLAKRHSL